MKQTVITEQESEQAASALQKLAGAVSSVIYGQNDLVETLIIGVVARGHILLEGLPGLGKTELVKTLSQAVQLDVKRIQFTPDLLPGDITGNPILQEEAGRRTFVFQPGPIFTNLLLADEINRASPKTQSALLEAMQERRVTVLGETHPLPEPFFVLATQNPIELEGTYPLPEAQLDRFLFKLQVTHKSPSVLEQIIQNREMGIDAKVAPVMTGADLRAIIDQARKVYLPETVANYIARLVHATHEVSCKKAIKHGASPRAALGLVAAGRARALFHGRINMSYEDVKSLAPFVLAHRLIMDYGAKIEGRTAEELVQQILDEVRPLDRSTPSLLQEER
ncbi:MAG: AAA family ATPase [Bdellovibrionota bacterium]